MCISIIIMLLIIISIIIPVYGASYTFTLTVNPATKTANLGNTVTEKTTKVVTVKIAEEGGKQEDDPIIIPDNPNTPDTPTTLDTPSTPASKDTPASQTTPSKSTSKSTGTTSTSTTSKATALPKAGIIASGIGIAVLAAIIVAIIELVKYKKIEK